MKKADRIRQYASNHPKATNLEIAQATGTTVSYIYKVVGKPAKRTQTQSKVSNKLERECNALRIKVNSLEAQLDILSTHVANLTDKKSKSWFRWGS